ncbi:hypothetical protein BO06_3768 [Burkholderia mallei]|nr:hypothetical protein DM76_4320 [Burkholderia mallei]KGS87121.1 hypothetical protein X976_3992 [Burkholderia pseudomallei MSHR7500]KGW43199.1 hypothetical protein Y597_5028 [Burkholderia pseudomallei MSHR1000]AIP74478.1 hypothetical protein DM51_3849 [Burkholderia mallei]AJX04564.1 hypothetical protein BM45_4362 [Burkholderia mallei]
MRAPPRPATRSEKRGPRPHAASPGDAHDHGFQRYTVMLLPLTLFFVTTYSPVDR